MVTQAWIPRYTTHSLANRGIHSTKSLFQSDLWTATIPMARSKTQHMTWPKTSKNWRSLFLNPIHSTGNESLHFDLEVGSFLVKAHISWLAIHPRLSYCHILTDRICITWLSLQESMINVWVLFMHSTRTQVTALWYTFTIPV